MLLFLALFAAFMGFSMAAGPMAVREEVVPQPARVDNNFFQSGRTDNGVPLQRQDR